MTWTDEESRYLITHATDGARVVAAALGTSAEEVEARAAEMGVMLSDAPERLEICPMCGCRYVRPHTSSGRDGICPVCFETRKAEAMEERAAFLRAHRRYEAAKRAVRRARASSREDG